MTQNQVAWKEDASLPLSLPMTIEKILESEVDLVGIPKRSFFQILAEYSSDKMEKDRLLEFCSAEGTDDRWDYANRPRRTLAEALRDFPKSVSDLPIEALARHIPSHSPPSLLYLLP